MKEYPKKTINEKLNKADRLCDKHSELCTMASFEKSWFKARGYYKKAWKAHKEMKRIYKKYLPSNK